MSLGVAFSFFHRKANISSTFRKANALHPAASIWCREEEERGGGDEKDVRH